MQACNSSSPITYLSSASGSSISAALAAYGLAVTVRVRGVFVSIVRNSSENFFRNSFPAWDAARMAAGTAALTSLRTISGTLSEIQLLITPPDMLLPIAVRPVLYSISICSRAAGSSRSLFSGITNDPTPLSTSTPALRK